MILIFFDRIIMDLTKLNKEQKKAIMHGNGPVLIVAGAGTGKTTVITRRVAHLIEQGKAKPEEILALTFTDKAAGEMEERVDDLLSCGYSDLWISTFHSFCRRVLEEHGMDIGLSPDFKLANPTTCNVLIRQNIDDLKLDYYKPLGNPAKFINALLSHFSRCKDQTVSPEDYLKYGKTMVGDDKERVKEVAMAYQCYQKLLLKNGYLDFGDLINYCLKLFKERPLILKKYRERFKYFLVDEFQDTNFSQYELVKILAAPKNNLTVCADDDQSIFFFRGASFSNILQFRKDFPKANEIVLIQNYRSRQNILDLAYKFIQANNPNRLEHINGISKKLISQEKEKGIIEHLHSKTSDQEIQSIINKITGILQKEKGSSLNDFAVLTRTNSAADIFSKACERANIPYQFVALKGLYSKPVIVDIISYFKLLDNYHENSAVYRVLRMPFLNISPEDIAKITQYSYKKFKSIYEALHELPLIKNISKQTVNSINKILRLIKKHSEMASQKNVSEVFLAFMTDSGYLKYLAKKDDEEEVNYVTQFYNRIKEFEDTNIDLRLNVFMEELKLELESGEDGKLAFDPDQGPEIVKIMTVHTAKGLEFKYVFLFRLVDRQFPMTNKSEPIELPEKLIKDIIPEGDFHLQEERRLFYVAMTRAKDGLFLTSAEDYGGSRDKKLSRFLTELGYARKITKTKINMETAETKKTKKKTKTILPDHFSFTQLRAFDTCPCQYKFAHILKIPTRSKAVFSFGRTVHNALYHFTMQTVKNKADLKTLLRFYKQEWIDEWYDSQKQRDEYYKLGEKALKQFYDAFSKQKPDILRINNEPALEQDFRLKIGGNTIIGKMDRIDKAGDMVEIIDYKTGKAKEKLLPKDRQQLLLYQLAAEEVFGLKVEKLTYHYLEDGKSVSFSASEKEKEKYREKIIEEIKQMKKSDFAATPGWDCAYCDFKDICEYAKK